ncbi:signal peptidase II [Cohnella lubricantis]|uniref:Lipoprotein signal peptidase n=1 Tax=Cohnella lubricantis TaxID=2163172 RepID=A0A841TBW5_9BACL|nr:signal peptidase II [Cohnella lubricantis]MBB6678963.1 signal peptidase II [Cohnella lubricantis]MBP2118818.1 signal peptidase II [Cohnella lubricantis]
MIFYLVAAIVLAADQLSKWWVRSHLEMGVASTVWGGLVHVLRLENTGATGNTFAGYGRWFVPIAILILAVVLYYRSKGKLRGAWMEVGTGLFVGGALGNAVDRAVFNAVTDFIKASKGHDAIMNIADIGLNAGVIVILLSTLFFRRKRAEAAQTAE